MSDDPDADLPILTIDYERELTSEEVRELAPDDQYQYLLAWFLHYYEDPAHETPYESREGGYQYIFGGPYDAYEVLAVEFGADVSDEVIEQVVERLQHNGLEWAPSANHPDRVDEELEEIPVDDIERLIRAMERGSAEPVPDEIGSADRRVVIEAAERLQQALEAVAPAGIGHNRPPEEIEADEPLTRHEISELKEDATYVAAEAAKEVPDWLTIAHVLKGLSATGQYILGKLDKVIDGAAQQIGKRIGDVVVAGSVLAVGAAVAGTAVGWEHVPHLLHTLAEAGLRWMLNRLG